MTRLVSLYKASPADYLVKYVAGRQKAAGLGLVVLVGPRTTLASYPQTVIDHPFSLTELSNDKQDVRVQGEFKIRLTPVILGNYNFSIDPVTGKYLSDDPVGKVCDTVVNMLRNSVRTAVQSRVLSDVLTNASVLQTELSTKVDKAALQQLGVDVTEIFVTSVNPASLDLKKALEAGAREQMLAGMDKAVAERRGQAAENERNLKEYELQTSLRLARQEAELIEVRNLNKLQEAQADEKAVRMKLTPYKELEASTLLALAIKDGNVGHLSLVPEIFTALKSATNGK